MRQLLDERGIPTPDSNGLYTSDPADGYGQDFHAREQIEVAYGITSYGFDNGRVSAGIRAAHTHRQLDHVSPLAVPVMLEIGRESVYGEASDELLAEAADELIKEAMS